MMEELDERSKRLLDAARGGMSPSVEDRLRVRGRMQAQLSAPSRSLHADAHSSLAGRVWSLFTVAALFGAGGFVAGYRAGRSVTSDPVGADPSHVAPVAAVSSNTPTTQGAPPTAPIEEPSVAPAVPVRTSAISASKKLSEPSPAQPQQRAPAAAGSGGAAPNASLEYELAAVRRMDLALREGRPALALSILDQLDRELPEGKLHEERSAGFVMARCAVGLGSHAALLREFESLHPDSMYLERVRRYCAPKEP